ncbi:M56 family metallopeptidase [Hungatella sp.]|jgi:beta-lactamase regulating signal transducer with metallopeptidase domain|uniref:M56 family metallopeptidase n=1 Tax=Hungatella sp. TaxID=2613924 RepID=UPI002A81A520|nr:M56 family metallopeptidase [Hungatella sp.]
MQKLFYLYLSVSLSASVIIAVLFLCRPLWKRRFSKSWQYYIWLLAVVRLLIPLSPSPGMIGRAADWGTERLAAGVSAAMASEDQYSPVPVSPVPVSPVPVFPMDDGYTQPKDEMSDQEEPFTAGDSGPQKPFSNPVAMAAVGSQAFSFLWVIWLIPALLIFCRQIFAYHRCLKLLRSVSVSAEDTAAAGICRSVALELKIRRRIPVYYCKETFSPMLAGILKPCILLPEIDLMPSELYDIFRHELIHYRRKDILYKWMIQLAVSIHWFNPLVYFMRRECDHACELSCDEKAISGLSAEQRMAYGDTLLFSLKGTNGTAGHAVSMPLCENTHMLKERLEAVMKTRKTTRIQKMASFMITALLTGSLLALGGFSAGAQETGLQVQKSSERKDAWLNDSANPESKKWRHSFKVTGFFVNKYGIRLAWNNDSSLYQTTRQVTAGDVYTVSFIEEMKQYADDPEVLEAIRLAILEERKTEENSTNQWVTNFIMTNPVVVGVDGPYRETYDELAVKFYEGNKLDYYSAVLKKASKKTQNTMIDRAYQEKNIPCFSLSDELLTTEERRQYLKKAYQDDQVPFFSILMDEADGDLLKETGEQAYQDEKISFFSILFSDLPEEDQIKYAYRAYEDGREQVFAIAVKALNSYQCEELAKRAYKEGKKSFLFLIPGASDDLDF